MIQGLDRATLERFVAQALSNVTTEYPAKLDHVLAGAADAATPAALHPAFHGSYDWHSCVHMHWMLARIRRACSGLESLRDVDALLSARLAPGPIAVELAYLARPGSASFERTYGWAWLLKLAAELSQHDDPQGRAWSSALTPLAQAFAQRFLAYLPRAGYPIRHGTHPNSAFGLTFAIDYSRALNQGELERQCEASARSWFAADRDAPAHWEPSGADFLSPSLMEAALMSRVLVPAEFSGWLGAFLPGLAAGEPRSLSLPVSVADRTDPQIVHLDGLNLSRAWCYATIGAALPTGDSRLSAACDASDRHLVAGWQGLTSGDYAGEHWLASFALLALEARTAAT